VCNPSLRAVRVLAAKKDEMKSTVKAVKKKPMNNHQKPRQVRVYLKV
jgi:hypothetical protein